MAGGNTGRQGGKAWLTMFCMAGRWYEPADVTVISDRHPGAAGRVAGFSPNPTLTLAAPLIPLF